MVAIHTREPDTPLAVSTKIGMVLGVLGLFTLITAYQFIPRTKKKPLPRGHALFTPRPKPTLFQRFRSFCSTFITKLKPKPKPKVPEGIVTPERRNRMRSFLLPDERQRKRDQIKEKFATSMRLKLPSSPSRPKFNLNSPLTTPLRPSRRYAAYAQLRDEDGVVNTPTTPASAMMSPWSSNEEDFPLIDPFRSPLRSGNQLDTPAPLHPLMPVYVPETPLRRIGGVADLPPVRIQHGSDDLTSESLIDVVTIMIKQQDEFMKPAASAENPFVIAEEDEWDSSTESDYSA
ncbi:hypothetical protein QCA50_006555 [Cerrena zonata]|uniref:Uncharacterized protein n=1 Tax=Cerrena zonata TaxID=2478898 RepID=A0AAW0G985_9APHY